MRPLAFPTAIVLVIVASSTGCTHQVPLRAGDVPLNTHVRINRPAAQAPISVSRSGAAPCTLHHVEGVVMAVVADSLVLSSVRNLRLAPGADASCNLIDGYITISRADLQEPTTTRRSFAALRTLGLGLVIYVVVALVVLVSLVGEGLEVP